MLEGLNAPVSNIGHTINPIHEHNASRLTKPGAITLMSDVDKFLSYVVRPMTYASYVVPLMASKEA